MRSTSLFQMILSHEGSSQCNSSFCSLVRSATGMKEWLHVLRKPEKNIVNMLLSSTLLSSSWRTHVLVQGSGMLKQAVFFR